MSKRVGAVAAVAPPAPAAKQPKAAAAKAPVAKAPEAKAPCARLARRIATKPTLPDSTRDDLANILARDVMKSVVPWVLEELGSFLCERNIIDDDSTPMNQRRPLVIDVPEQDKSALTSYKEPWVPWNCVQSLKQSKCYEAGGNVCWLDPELASEYLIPNPTPSWSWVLDCARQNFKEFEGGTGGKRIMFPIGLSAYWQEDPRVLDTGVPCGAVPLGAHGFIYGWYVAVFLAMDEADTQRVARLYEAALTTTITLYAQCDLPTLALHAMHFSEVVRHGSQVLVDSFLTFAQKVHSMGKVELETLRRAGVRYAGASVSQTMLKAINHVKNIRGNAAELIGRIDRQFGYDVLSGNYNKMLRLLQGTANNKSGSQADLVEWCLQTMLVLLQRGECTESDFKADSFIKSKDGTPSWIATCCVQRQFVLHVASVVDNTRKVDEPLAEKLIELVTTKFANPMEYHKICPCKEDQDVGMSEDEDVATQQASSGSEYVEMLEQKLPKAGPLLAEVLRKVYDGSYDTVFAALAAEEAAATEQALQSQSDALGDFGRDFDEVLKAMHTAQAVVGTSGGSAPKPSLKSLIRQASDTGHDDGEATAQREEVWQKAVQKRKKLVQFGMVKNPKAIMSYVDAFKKATASQWKGKPKDYRMFILSADLISDSGDSPWQAKASIPTKIVETMLEFLKLQRAGQHDVLVAFDGCGRDVRGMLGSSLVQLPRTSEVFIVYNNSWNSWVRRQHFLSSNNCEVGYVTLPNSRGKFTCKDRPSGFNGAGEASSHFTSMTGVALPPRTRLPRISADEKAKVFGKSGCLPPKWTKSIPAGCPMFWGETKSVAFWQQMLTELDVKTVVDMTPGSGALADASMRLGCSYFGFVSDVVHMGWLTNVVDRASCRHIVKSGTFLYEESLATSLKDLFADIVEDEPGEMDGEHPDDCVKASDDENDIDADDST